MSSLRNTTLPGVAARLRPTSKPLASTWRGRPLLLRQVVEEGHRALDDARARGVERPLQRRRVHREEVGGRHRVQREVERELGLAGDRLVDRRGGDRRRGRTGTSTGRPAACRRTPGSCSTPGRRSAGPSGRPAPATRSRGRTTGWRPPWGCGRGPSPTAGWPVRCLSGLARLDCRGRVQRLAEPRRVEVLEQVGLGRQHPCSSFGNIARRLIHHATILRGKPTTPHPLPLTGSSHARHLRTTQTPRQWRFC